MDFLESRQQHVIVHEKISYEASVISGVPQGTVISPLQVLLFINDLPEVVQVRLFADDCILFRIIKFESHNVFLQRDIDALHQ